MYRLRLSLIMAVIVSVIGTGWLADQLFSRLADSGVEPVQHLQVRGRTLLMLVENDMLSAVALQLFIDGDVDLHSFSNTIDTDAPEITESIYLMGIDELALPQTLREQLLSGDELLLESNERLHWYRRVGLTNDVLSISRSVLPGETNFVRFLFTMFFYICVAGLILAWVYPLVLQLQRLGIAADSLGKGDLSRRIPTRAGNRLHQLESQFNRMAQRLQLLVEDNKLLSGAVSHDLRTPLARLRFGIDVLHEKFDDEGEWSAAQRQDIQRYLDRISDDLVLMESLVTALLEFARLDQSLQEIPMVKIRLTDIIREQGRADTRHTVDVQFQLKTSNDVVMGDERYARMLLSNLVENAIRFAENRVLIILYEQGGELFLSVEDDGCGFEPGTHQQLLKPFERGENLVENDWPDTSDKGYGLGLAIVERLSQWFGARLTLGSSEDLGGAKVHVQFKLVKPPIK